MISNSMRFLPRKNIVTPQGHQDKLINHQSAYSPSFPSAKFPSLRDHPYFLIYSTVGSLPWLVWNFFTSFGEALIPLPVAAWLPPAPLPISI